MKVQIKYPTAKCSYCGKPYTKTHNRQKYCSTECAKNAHREHKRNWAYRNYHKNKQHINTTKLGTRTIGPQRNPNPEREAQIVQNEIERIGLHIS